MKDIEKIIMNELNNMLKDDVSVMHVSIAGKHNTKNIQILLDSDEGVSLDDCSFVTKLAKKTIELNEYLDDDYSLEVSSPGINRPLFTFNDFLKFQGEKVHIELKKSINNQKRFKGMYEIKNQDILIFHKNEKIKITIDDIKKANLIREIKI